MSDDQNKSDNQLFIESLGLHKLIDEDNKELSINEQKEFLDSINKLTHQDVANHKKNSLEKNCPKKQQKYKKKISKNKKSYIVIDLHGFTEEKAHNHLQNYIEKFTKPSGILLLVIHGKGQGILKKMVWDMAKYDTRIAEIKFAPLKLGGYGASILRLK